MIWTALISAASIAAVQLPSPEAESYVVRNDTRRTFTCGLRIPHRMSIDRFVLRPGGEWRQPTGRQVERRLTCDGQLPLPRWRLRPGEVYSLVEDPESRRLHLMVRPPRRAD